MAFGGWMKYPVHYPLGLWLADHCVGHPQNLELATENLEHETSRCVTTNPFQAPQPSLLDLRDTVLGPWLSYAFTASGGRVIHSYVDSPSVACLLLFRN